MASFLFFSGILRKNSQLSAVALLVIFIYGGLFWGLFPIYQNVSWEGHLTGFIAGALVAFIYRKEGPKEKNIIGKLRKIWKLMIMNQIIILTNSYLTENQILK